MQLNPAEILNRFDFLIKLAIHAQVEKYGIKTAELG
jgi:hypothetical protein